jgi:hypothetical protein
MIVRTDVRCSGELTNAFVASEELANLIPRSDNSFFSLATVSNIACVEYGLLARLPRHDLSYQS